MRMTGVRQLAVGALALGVFLIAGAAWAVRTELNISSLHGLKAVYLIIQPLDSDVVKDGLSLDEVRTAVEHRLQAAGIRLVSEDNLGERGTGILLLAIDSVRNTAGLYASSVRVELIQVAALARDPDMLVPATTWTAGIVAMTGSSRVSRLGDVAVAVIDEFIKDYRTANREPTEEIKSDGSL